MNPLGELEFPLLTKAGFGDFTLEYDVETDALTISKGQQAIVRDHAGQIENLGVTVADSKVFRSLGERMLRTFAVQPSERKKQAEDIQN